MARFRRNPNLNRARISGSSTDPLKVIDGRRFDFLVSFRLKSRAKARAKAVQKNNLRVRVIPFILNGKKRFGIWTSPGKPGRR